MIAVILFTAPVMAFLTNPTSMGFGDYSSNVLRVFRNLIETGDCLYTFHYKLEFASDNYSTETASDTIYFQIHDNTGILKATWSPYVYPYFLTNGYGDGVTGVYFSASDNASAWGSAAEISINGWPAYFAGLTPFSYTLTPGDYITETSQEDNRAALKDLILLWCDRLDAIYTDTGVILKASSDGNEILSDLGDTYFGSAIEGLQAMCPDLFYIQTYIPSQMDTSYNMTMASFYADRMSGSEWEKGFDKMGEGIGVSGTVMAALIFMVIAFAVCIASVKKDWGIEAGAGISVFIGIAAAVIMGNVLFAILMIISLAAVIALVWLLMLRRVG
jgi:hypothetical protein